MGNFKRSHRKLWLKSVLKLLIFLGSQKCSNLDLEWLNVMSGAFGEFTGIIGLVTLLHDPFLSQFTLYYVPF